MQLSKVEINGRRWYKGPDGMIIPSAGSVLDILFPEGKDFIKEADMARGSACHEEMARALLAKINGEAYEPTHPDVDPIRIYAVLEYLSRFQLEALAIESPTYFLGIGMTPDYLAAETHPDGGNIKHLYDWKFAESIQESYFYQAELYGRAEKVHKITIVQCDRKGNVYPHKVTADPERWELIKSAINCRLHIDKKELKRYVK